MKINIEFFSILSEWVGVRHIDIILPDDGTYGDLLDLIGRRYSCNMPEQLWNKESMNFAHQVIAVKNGVRIEEKSILLNNGDQIKFLPMMAGG